MADKCPKCGWTTRSFNCGTLAFGKRCPNPDCDFEERPETMDEQVVKNIVADALDAVVEQWLRRASIPDALVTVVARLREPPRPEPKFPIWASAYQIGDSSMSTIRIIRTVAEGQVAVRFPDGTHAGDETSEVSWEPLNLQAVIDRLNLEDAAKEKER